MRWLLLTSIAALGACSVLTDLSGLGAPGGADAADASDAQTEFDVAAFTPPSCNGLAAQAGAPWPVQGGCASRIGLSSKVGPKTSNVKWSLTYDTQYATCSTPVVTADGTIIVGTENNSGGVVAINPNGTVQWTGVVGNMTGAAAIGNQAIYAGTGSHLAAIDFSGAQAWAALDAGKAIDSSPVIAPDGTIYVGSYDGNIYALDAAGGIAWAFQTGAPVVDAPALAADGTILCASTNFTLYALHADGTLAWSQKAQGDFSTAVIAPDGTIYAASADTKLYAYTPSGQTRWAFSAGGALHAPALGPDATIYVGSNDGALYAVTPDGKQKWKFTTQGVVSAIPVVSVEGVVYFGSSDGSFYAINPDGSLSWSAFIGDTCDNSAAIGFNGTLYVTSNVTLDGGLDAATSASRLYAFGP